MSHRSGSTSGGGGADDANGSGPLHHPLDWTNALPPSLSQPPDVAWVGGGAGAGNPVGNPVGVVGQRPGSHHLWSAPWHQQHQLQYQQQMQPPGRLPPGISVGPTASPFTEGVPQNLHPPFGLSLLPAPPMVSEGHPMAANDLRLPTSSSSAHWSQSQSNSSLFSFGPLDANAPPPLEPPATVTLPCHAPSSSTPTSGNFNRVYDPFTSSESLLWKASSQSPKPLHNAMPNGLVNPMPNLMPNALPNVVPTTMFHPSASPGLPKKLIAGSSFDGEYLDVSPANNLQSRRYSSPGAAAAAAAAGAPLIKMSDSPFPPDSSNQALALLQAEMNAQNESAAVKAERPGAANPEPSATGGANSKHRKSNSLNSVPLDSADGGDNSSSSSSTSSRKNDGAGGRGSKKNGGKSKGGEAVTVSKAATVDGAPQSTTPKKTPSLGKLRSYSDVTANKCGAANVGGQNAKASTTPSQSQPSAQSETIPAQKASTTTTTTTSTSTSTTPKPAIPALMSLNSFPVSVSSNHSPAISPPPRHTTWAGNLFPDAFKQKRENRVVGAGNTASDVKTTPRAKETKEQRSGAKSVHAGSNGDVFGGGGGGRSDPEANRRHRTSRSNSASDKAQASASLKSRPNGPVTAGKATPIKTAVAAAAPSKESLCSSPFYSASTVQPSSANSDTFVLNNGKVVKNHNNNVGSADSFSKKHPNFMDNLHPSTSAKSFGFSQLHNLLTSDGEREEDSEGEREEEMEDDEREEDNEEDQGSEDDAANVALEETPTRRRPFVNKSDNGRKKNNNKNGAGDRSCLAPEKNALAAQSLNNHANHTRATQTGRGATPPGASAPGRQHNAGGGLNGGSAAGKWSVDANPSVFAHMARDVSSFAKYFWRSSKHHVRRIYELYLSKVLAGVKWFLRQLLILGLVTAVASFKIAVFLAVNSFRTLKFVTCAGRDLIVLRLSDKPPFKWLAKLFRRFFPGGDGGGSRRVKIGLEENIALPTTGDEALKRLLAGKGKDPYSILGLRSDASDEDVKKYYRRQAMLVHPDKNQEVGADEAFKILGHAFDVLGDAEKRAKYDARAVHDAEMRDALDELGNLLNRLQRKMEETANTMRCDQCNGKHKRHPTERPWYAARYCDRCRVRHSAKEGDVWAETVYFGLMWRYYALMNGAVFDITDWAKCQVKKENFKRMAANSHQVIYRLSGDGSGRGGGGGRGGGVGGGGGNRSGESWMPEPGGSKARTPSEAEIENLISNFFAHKNSGGAGGVPGGGAASSSATPGAANSSSNNCASKSGGKKYKKKRH